jgi:hypothetical protein
MGDYRANPYCRTFCVRVFDPIGTEIEEGAVVFLLCVIKKSSFIPVVKCYRSLGVAVHFQLALHAFGAFGHTKPPRLFITILINEAEFHIR